MLLESLMIPTSKFIINTKRSKKYEMTWVRCQFHLLVKEFLLKKNSRNQILQNCKLVIK